MEAVIHAARAGKPAPVQAAAVLDRLGLTALARTRLDRLSGGQRQLTSLAQALVRRRGLLLLDEPLSALDLRHQHAVLTVLRRLAAYGLIVVAVLHDLSLAATWADRVVLIHGGGVAADGPPERAVIAATLAEVYGVAATVRRGDDRSTSIVVTRLLDP